MPGVTPFGACSHNVPQSRMGNSLMALVLYSKWRKVNHNLLWSVFVTEHCAVQGEQLY